MQKYRAYIQIVFIMVCLWIGVEFYLFTSYLESGGTGAFYERPPGVEAFLPISALMSIYYYLQTGVIHSAHPAGFFILLAIILVSFVFGKSFCSWICPIGTLSEYVGEFSDRVQKKLFKRIFRLPRWLDYPLRSLKYLLLGFFVYSIFFAMSVYALQAFLDSPYNLIADVKMYYFFAEISQFALIVIAVLFVLSVLIRNFWCRYLCPYGALLGIFTLLSPNKIKRNQTSCIDCNLCAKACPAFIKVDKVKTVISDECSTCMSCVDACPVADTLDLKPVFIADKISRKFVSFGVISIFIFVTGAAMLAGKWQNDVSKEEYIKLYEIRNSLGHPRSTSDIRELNKQAEPKNTDKEKSDRNIYEKPDKNTYPAP